MWSLTIFVVYPTITTVVVMIAFMLSSGFAGFSIISYSGNYDYREYGD